MHPDLYILVHFERSIYHRGIKILGTLGIRHGEGGRGGDRVDAGMSEARGCSKVEYDLEGEMMALKFFLFSFLKLNLLG